MNKKIINLLLVIVVLILVAINIMIYINNHKEVSTNNNINETNLTQQNNMTVSEEKIQNIVNSKMEKMTERDRLQTYFGTFITYIEDKEFESAYKLLNENFKNNYFKDIETFKNYFENYPKNLMVNYTNIERQGEIFVLTVEISDMFDEETEPITKRIVIRENGLNDFKISFDV